MSYRQPRFPLRRAAHRRPRTIAGAEPTRTPHNPRTKASAACAVRDRPSSFRDPDQRNRTNDTHAKRATKSLTQDHGFARFARPAGVLAGGVLASWREEPFLVVVLSAAATTALRLAKFTEQTRLPSRPASPLVAAAVSNGDTEPTETLALVLQSQHHEPANGTVNATCVRRRPGTRSRAALPGHRLLRERRIGIPQAIDLPSTFRGPDVHPRCTLVLVLPSLLARKAAGHHRQ